MQWDSAASELIDAKTTDANTTVTDLLIHIHDDEHQAILDTLEATRDFSKDEVIIVLTGAQDEQLCLKALPADAQDYLFKDTLKGEVLRRSIRYSIERVNMLKNVEAHADEIRHREIITMLGYEVAYFTNDNGAIDAYKTAKNAGNRSSIRASIHKDAADEHIARWRQALENLRAGCSTKFRRRFP